MTILDVFAACLCLFYFPIPVYWLLVHPLAGFWRGRHHLAMSTALILAWLPAAWFLWSFRARLFASANAPWWAVTMGLACVLLDAAILYRVHLELGSDRLVGKTELQGAGELATAGLYARVRHPRYTAMVVGMLGVCLLAATLLLWAVTAVWYLLVLLSVYFEERELLSRFGDSYRSYRQRVPAFLPFRFWPQKD